MAQTPDKACIEDPRQTKTRELIQALNKKFNAYILFAIIYGLVFVNYIDNISGGYSGYHLWLVIMYFFPFIALSIFFDKNWELTLGLGVVVSLMNDVFYGAVRSIMGLPINLNYYYHAWLIPGNATLFTLNLGFAVLPVISWMMAISIYARIIASFFLLRSWKAQAKIKCINQPKI